MEYTISVLKAQRNRIRVVRNLRKAQLDAMPFITKAENIKIREMDLQISELEKAINILKLNATP